LAVTYYIHQIWIPSYRHQTPNTEEEKINVMKRKFKKKVDKVCQWLVTGWWFSPGTLVSSTKNLTAMILLKYC